MKLGVKQRQILDGLENLSAWQSDAGFLNRWSSGSPSEMERILKSLVKKGLVARDKTGMHSITRAGRDSLVAHQRERR